MSSFSDTARARLRSVAINLTVLAGGILAALLLLEALLHWHNPFQVRIKGNRIVLLTDTQVHINNDIIGSLDRSITVTRNSLGFRGPNPPPDFESYLTIFTVGGSTTQCFFQSDDKTWTARLGDNLQRSFRNVWINNAGLDGHSTYGHLVLLEDIIRPLHPKVVLFLVGANDVTRDPDADFDAENVKGSISFRSPTAFVKSLSAYSEVAALIANSYRSLNAYKQGLRHSYLELKKEPYIDVPVDEQKRYVERNGGRYLQLYQDRLHRIVEVSRASNIEPVLITQPLLAGDAIDDVTHVDLARVTTSPGHNGKMYWDVLEVYNDVTRRVGREQNVQVVDLARQLPKSSRYFYDFIHYTNEGSQAVADILYRNLCGPFREKFEGHSVGPCPE
jgi:lysophospholipase L1-like esterase